MLAVRNISSYNRTTFAYDAATGNITRREADGPLLGLAVERFDYDQLDRLSGINGQPIRYDALGNIAQMPGVGAMQHAGYQLNALTAQAGFAKPEVEIEYAANGRARQLGMCIQQSGLGLGLSFEEQSLRPTLPTEQGIMSAKDLILRARDPIPSDEDPIMPIPPDKRPWWSTETHRMNITHGPGGVRLRSVEESSFFMEHATAHRHGSYIKEAVTQKRSATVRYYTADAERELVGDKTSDYTYIQSPNGLIAAVKTSGTQHDAMLLATDHLGSIIGVWNANGTLLEEHRYSAWGLRTSSTATPRLRRGFTGHEHLAQFGLIDMQARLYDPHLGRFLAPDPYVQTPSMSMNFNRYTYCFNNPLKYTDPTGEFCIGAAIFIGGFINFAIQGITDNIHSFGDCVKAWTIGGLSGVCGAWAGAAVSGALGAATSVGSAIGYGALAGAAGGAAGGFISGAGAALKPNASIKDVMLGGLIGAGLGAASGALIGGLGGGLSFRKEAAVFRKGCSDLNIDPAEAVPATDQFLSDAQKAWFPDAPMDKVREFTVENVPEGFFNQSPEHAKAAGATIAMSSKGKLTDFSKVYFNKDLAFTSAKQLFFTMGHELVHVSQYAALAGECIYSTTRAEGFFKMLDNQAYTYQTYLGDKTHSPIPTNYTKYFNETLWVNFKWTYTHSFKYPF